MSYNVWTCLTCFICLGIFIFTFIFLLSRKIRRKIGIFKSKSLFVAACVARLPALASEFSPEMTLSPQVKIIINYAVMFTFKMISTVQCAFELRFFENKTKRIVFAKNKPFMDFFLPLTEWLPLREFLLFVQKFKNKFTTHPFSGQRVPGVGVERNNSETVWERFSSLNFLGWLACYVTSGFNLICCRFLFIKTSSFTAWRVFCSTSRLCAKKFLWKQTFHAKLSVLFERKTFKKCTRKASHTKKFFLPCWANVLNNCTSLIRFSRFRLTRIRNETIEQGGKIPICKYFYVTIRFQIPFCECSKIFWWEK